jgi:hypothetical protein
MNPEDQYDRLLQDEDGCYYANFIDGEGFEFQVRFHYDGYAHIKVPDLTCLDLSMETLAEIQRFLSTAEMLYRIKSDEGMGDFNASWN